MFPSWTSLCASWALWISVRIRTDFGTGPVAGATPYAGAQSINANANFTDAGSQLVVPSDCEMVPLRPRPRPRSTLLIPSNSDNPSDTDTVSLPLGSE